MRVVDKSRKRLWECVLLAMDCNNLQHQNSTIKVILFQLRTRQEKELNDVKAETYYNLHIMSSLQTCSQEANNVVIGPDHQVTNIQLQNQASWNWSLYKDRSSTLQLNAQVVLQSTIPDPCCARSKMLYISEAGRAWCRGEWWEGLTSRSWATACTDWNQATAGRKVANGRWTACTKATSVWRAKGMSFVGWSAACSQAASCHNSIEN